MMTHATGTRQDLTLKPDEHLAPLKRAFVQRSAAYDLLVHGETDPAEIREAMTEELIASLPEALCACRADLAPASHQTQREWMAVKVGAWLRLGHGNSWTDAKTTEFIVGQVEEFAGEPFGLVMEAIGEARRKVEYADKFTKWVADAIQPAVAQLRLEEERLVKLSEIAAG
jgi:hypothetical protein